MANAKFVLGKLSEQRCLCGTFSYMLDAWGVLGIDQTRTQHA
jgi:hypothetical protein